MPRIKVIPVIGFILSIITSSVGNAQWTQTEGPIDSLHVFSILAGDTLSLACTNEGLFYTTKLPGRWQRLTNEDTRACTFMGNKIVGADQKWGNIIIDLSKPNIIVDTLYNMTREIKTICADTGCFYCCNGSDSFFKYCRSTKDFASYLLAIPDSQRPYCNINKLKLTDSTLFCATTLGIFKYNLDKMEMLSASNGLPEGNVQLLEVINDSLFAGIENRLYISTNHGDAWRHLYSFSSLVSSVAVSKGRLYAGTLGEGVYRSKNGGATWESFNSGLTSRQISSLTKWNNLLLCGTTKDGLFYTSDNVWIKGNKGMICTGTSAMFASRNSVIAYENGNIYRLLDSTNWENIPLGIGELDNFFYSNDTIFFTPSFYNTLKEDIYYSVDRGENWKGIQTNQFLKIEPYRIFYKFNRLYITGHGITYYSDDFGESWTKIEIPNNTYALFDCRATQEITFCDRELQCFLLRADENSTWVSHAEGLSHHHYLNFLTYTSDAFYANIYLSVYVKSDTCPFWTRVSNTPSWNRGIRSSAHYGKNLFISYYNGVSYTDDYGMTWKNLNEGLQDITLIGPLIINNNTLYAGTYGNGIWKYDLNTLHLSESAICPCTRKKLLFYPNPVTDYLYIQTDDSLDVDIKISDMSGKLVFKRRKDLQGPVDVSQLANGIYIITIHTDDDNFFIGKLCKIN